MMSANGLVEIGSVCMVPRPVLREGASKTRQLIDNGYG
jgi:hypothetical protein